MLGRNEVMMSTDSAVSAKFPHMCIVCHRKKPSGTMRVGGPIYRNWLSHFSSTPDIVVQVPVCRCCRWYFRLMESGGMALWLVSAVIIFWFIDATIRQHIPRSLGQLAIVVGTSPVAWAWGKLLRPPLELGGTENVILFRFRNDVYWNYFMLINFCGESQEVS